MSVPRSEHDAGYGLHITHRINRMLNPDADVHPDVRVAPGFAAAQAAYDAQTPAYLDAPSGIAEIEMTIALSVAVDNGTVTITHLNSRRLDTATAAILLDVLGRKEVENLAEEELE